MPLTRRDISSFLSEMGRRRVYRVAAWYAAFAVAVLELAFNVFPLLGFPEWSEKLVLALVVAGAPVTLALAWIFDITPRGVTRTEARGADPQPPPRRQARDAERSVAVLPFSQPGGGADWFCDGMTEDIIAALTCVRELKVISRTSVMQYRDTRKSVPEIAAELGVAHVLEGSVRRAGDRVRIVAQLVDARTDEHLWAETYDRLVEDVFAIQRDVARRIADSLSATITAAERDRLGRGPTASMEAYEAFLRGRHLWNQRTERAVRDGIRWLEKALELDPGFALAWAGLAEAKVTLALYGAAPPRDVMPEARRAAERALEADPELAEALTPLAAIRAYYDWDWSGAEKDFRRAVAANPRYPTAWHWYANALSAMGRFADARAALEHARELDPLSPAVLTSAGILSYFERRFDDAARELRGVLELHPRFPLAHLFLGVAEEAAGRTDAALPPLRAAVELSGGSAETRAALAYALARSGAVTEARRLQGELSREEYVSPVQLACVHVGLGEPAAALAALEEGLRLRSTEMAWLAARPTFDPLRGEARFRGLLDEVGLARVGPGPTPRRERGSLDAVGSADTNDEVPVR